MGSLRSTHYAAFLRGWEQYLCPIDPQAKSATIESGLIGPSLRRLHSAESTCGSDTQCNARGSNAKMTGRETNQHEKECLFPDDCPADGCCVGSAHDSSPCRPGCPVLPGQPRRPGGRDALPNCRALWRHGCCDSGGEWPGKRQPHLRGHGFADPGLRLRGQRRWQLHELCCQQPQWLINPISKHFGRLHQSLHHPAGRHALRCRCALWSSRIHSGERQRTQHIVDALCRATPRSVWLGREHDDFRCTTLELSAEDRQRVQQSLHGHSKRYAFQHRPPVQRQHRQPQAVERSDHRLDLGWPVAEDAGRFVLVCPIRGCDSRRCTVGTALRKHGGSSADTAASQTDRRCDTSGARGAGADGDPAHGHAAHRADPGAVTPADSRNGRIIA